MGCSSDNGPSRIGQGRDVALSSSRCRDRDPTTCEGIRHRCPRDKKKNKKRRSACVRACVLKKQNGDNLDTQRAVMV